MSPDKDNTGDLPSFVISVTGNFTTEPIGEVLRFWLARLALESGRIEFSNYNQVFQELVAPDSALGSNVPGINLLLIRFEDWGRDQAHALRADTISAAGREFVAILTSFAQRARRPTVVAMCPPSQTALNELGAILRNLQENTARALTGLRGVSVITPQETADLYPVTTVDDPEADRVGHVPFTQEYWAALGAMAMRRARTFLQPPRKVIVVDADNTLWGGVTGELGATDVDLSGEWLVLQEFLRERKKQGMLLALVSKNSEADVAEVFKRPEMALCREDFVSWKVNWEAKSRNIIALGRELELGLDAFLFLDDNPAECAEVAANCPGVSTLLLPAGPHQIPGFLRHVWAFDLGQATAVDAARTELYRQQSERVRFLESSSTYDEFIAGLQLQVDISPIGPGEYARAAQLLERTNQFNTTTIRRTAVELANLLESGERRSMLVSARDRFGDYGQIGLALFFRDQQTLLVESLLLSCRVLGKGVEHRVLAALGEEAERMGVGELVVPFKPTERNQPAEKFFVSLGDVRRCDGEFRIDATAAAAAHFEPARYAQLETPAEDVPRASRRPSRVDFLSIANELNTAKAIADAVARYRWRPRPQLPNAFVAPRTSTEARMVKIFEEVLGIGPIGVTDSFLNLGGRSLQAVSVASRLSSEFGVRVPLNLVLSTPTVAELQREIAHDRPGASVPFVANTKPWRLSAAQERLWFLDQFIPNRAAYNIPIGWRIRGPLNLAVLSDAMSRMASRHSTLRSSFAATEGGTELRVSDTPIVSLRRLSAASEAEALSLADEEARGQFDLVHGPVFRAVVIALSPVDHLLVLNIHHIVADGWSMGILARELAEAYAAALSGRPIAWSPLPVAYGDYAIWQQERMTQGDFQTDLEYWRRELQGAPSLLELPMDSPRPSSLTYRGDVARAQAPSSLRRAVENLAEREQCTPFMVLLAAFQTLLYRYSQQEDIVVGVPVAGRTHSATEGLIGCFVNTLAIRALLDGANSFRNHLQLVRRKVLDALVHQELPFEHLVNELGIERDLSRSPLFQVMLVLQDIPASDFALEGTTASGLPLHNGGAKFDLVFEVTPNADGYGLAFEFNTDLVRPETAARMMRHFTQLLEHACAAPELPLTSLALMEPSEVKQMLSFVNEESGHFGSVECLHEWFERVADAAPDAAALSFEGQVVSYGELNRRANQIAHYLIASGIGPDVLVGICLDRSPDLVTAILGIVKAGGAYLPIDLSYPADRLAFMLADAAVPVLLTEKKLAPSLPPHAASTICLDDAETILGSQPVANPTTQVTPDNAAYVIYTSGSTGKPKGCIVTHRNVARLMRATERWFHFDERDVWTLFHSTAFDFSVWEIWGALLYGGRLVIVPFIVSRSPESFYELLAAERVTVLNQTPSAFRQLIQAEEAVGQTALALRYVIFGGEALEMNSLRPWFERHGDEQPRLVNMYGITETTVHVTYRPLAKNDLSGGSVIGVPIPDLRVYILDPQRRPVPIGVPGEMYVGGAGLARGYLNRVELTSERFVPDSLSGEPGARLYRTGDLARFLPGRDIEYLGRIDHQVKIRGFRIELGEIESVLCQHAAVREALVLAREEAAGTKQLVGYVAVSGEAPSVAALRDHLKKKVPDYMVPAAFVFLEKFPLTTNGKIDRKALPAPEQERPAVGAAFVAPRTTVEEALASIWAKVLRLERVGVRDNFFELGGDSILTIQIVSLARQARLALSPKLLFQYQTIEELAANVPAEVQRPSAVQGTVQGTAPLTPIQHWFFSQERAEAHHYNQAFLFTVREPLQFEPLSRALGLLERHHDALRLRLPSTTHPGAQTFAAPSSEVPLDRVDLSTLSDADVVGAIEFAASQAQRQLDFINGPLWRAVYFDLGPGRGARLLLAIHHFAVDGVSWRILVEDLERAYDQERAGVAAHLPAKTTSVKEWAERLTDAVTQRKIPGDSRYWHALASGPGAPLPVELNVGENTEGSARTAKVRLSKDETEALLHRAPAAYGTQMNDLLLVALGRTLSEWAGTTSLLIDLEGHGREELFEGADLSRTVGWFTSIYPVRINAPARRGIAEWIKSVKEQLRAVPARGIGYGMHRYLAGDTQLSSGPEPQVLFNYLGQFDQVVGGSRLFGFANEPIGPWHSPRATRRHLLEVNCLVVNGQLEFEWTFSENRNRTTTIEHLAQQCLNELNEIIRHCTTPGVRGATPSDFPLVALDQVAVDSLLLRIPELEDAYPLSAIQTLFYAAAANDTTAVTDHWYGTLSGPLDEERFRHAWESVFERHPVLRTSFQSAGLPEPLQAVHRGLRSLCRVEDWRGMSERDQASRWSAMLEADRRQGMDLARAPLSRLSLVRLGDQRYKFLWTVPALLLDGWSWPVVFRELSQLYDSLGSDQPQSLPPAHSYRDYVAWLEGRTWEESEEFWRGALKGVTEPTPLVAEMVTPPPVSGRRNARWSVALDPSMSRRLVHLARQQQLTPNTLIQAAWALVLTRLSGRKDVVFGAAFSGRPPQLPGVEGIVGPFVNNLPVRVQVDESASIRSFLQELQGRLLRVNEYQFTPLARIQSWTDVAWRVRLFDSIVVVQNYMVDETARRLGDAVSISHFVGPIHTNFPLLIVVEPQEAWQFTLIYDEYELPQQAVCRWSDDLVRTLSEFVASPEGAVAALLAQLSTPVRSTPAKPRWRVSSQNPVPPQTELERQLAQVWEEMLQIDNISTEENLFDLGAHSLLVVQLHRRLCETTGQSFPLVTMFEFPTIHGLARHLSHHDERGSSGEVRTRAQRQRDAMLRVGRGSARK